MLEQEGLDQAVAAHQPQGLLPPRFGQRSALVALVLSEPHLLQTDEHVGDRRRGDREPVGDVLGGGRARPSNFPYRLQVVTNRRRGRLGCCSTVHLDTNANREKQDYQINYHLTLRASYM